MRYDKAAKVFVCCGKYYAVTKSNETKTIKCQCCGAKLNDENNLVIRPLITIVR